MTTTKVSGVVRYDDMEVDDDALRKIKEDLKETDENRRKCLEALKIKLLNTADLNPCLDESFLLAYLRVCKYDCNKAYHRIIEGYTERYDLPHLYNNYTTSAVKMAAGARKFLGCPYRAKDNSCVLILKRLDYDPSKIPYETILRAFCMVGDVLMRQPLNQMFGYTVVMDMKVSSWTNWSEYTPARLKTIARMFQKCVALRLKAFHVINAPPIYFILYSIIYPFLSTKIRNRIFIHKNNSSLHAYVDPKYLPEECGGCLQQSELINIFDRMFDEEDFLQKHSQYGFIKK